VTLILKRLFLAIDLPERIIDDISATYMAIPGVRWTGEEQLHLTLRFFGELPGDRESALIKVLSTIAARPFSLRVKGAGFFPPRGETRVLWVGIAQEPVLPKLVSAIETSVVRAGFKREPRKFTGHITVARCSHAPSDRLAEYLIANSLFTTESFEVNAFHLYSSHLGKNHATYTREVSFTFGGSNSPL
jgi:RNA 2',3'-cyclic 3'-phosphodiesterase